MLHKEAVEPLTILAGHNDYLVNRIFILHYI